MGILKQVSQDEAEYMAKEEVICTRHVQQIDLILGRILTNEYGAFRDYMAYSHVDGGDYDDDLFSTTIHIAHPDFLPIRIDIIRIRNTPRWDKENYGFIFMYKKTIFKVIKYWAVRTHFWEVVHVGN